MGICAYPKPPSALCGMKCVDGTGECDPYGRSIGSTATLTLCHATRQMRDMADPMGCDTLHQPRRGLVQMKDMADPEGCDTLHQHQPRGRIISGPDESDTHGRPSGSTATPTRCHVPGQMKDMADPKGCDTLHQPRHSLVPMKDMADPEGCDTLHQC